MNTLSRCRGTGIALAVGLVLGSLSEAHAQTGDKKAGTDDKAFTFEMRAKPWSAVFEWLTEKTGREFVSPVSPSGTLNFIAPKGKKYSIPQIIDIINDGLLKEKWVLLN